MSPVVAKDRHEQVRSTVGDERVLNEVGRGCDEHGELEHLLYSCRAVTRGGGDLGHDAQGSGSRRVVAAFQVRGADDPGMRRLSLLDANLPGDVEQIAVTAGSAEVGHG